MSKVYELLPLLGLVIYVFIHDNIHLVAKPFSQKIAKLVNFALEKTH
jgi:hypothetical protein